MTMITDKVLLSDCGKCLVVDDNPKDRYEIQIDGVKDFIIVQAGGTVRHPAFGFQHPNIALTTKSLFDFKHYRKSGSKFWTEQAGQIHFLIIPCNKVYILPEKGYSYIAAEINGVKVHFNVSGGGGIGWTDYLHTNTSYFN